MILKFLKVEEQRRTLKTVKGLEVAFTVILRRTMTSCLISGMLRLNNVMTSWHIVAYVPNHEIFDNLVALEGDKARINRQSYKFDSSYLLNYVVFM